MVQRREHKVMVDGSRINGFAVRVEIVGGMQVGGRPNHHIRSGPPEKIFRLCPSDAASPIE